MAKREDGSAATLIDVPSKQYKAVRKTR